MRRSRRASQRSRCPALRHTREKEAELPDLAEGKPHFFDAVYRVARLIPQGKVATYGQIAAILGQPRAARAVGYALRVCPDWLDVPWQRVINSQGAISPGGDPERPPIQRVLLEAEGVEFDSEDRIDLACHRWEGPAEEVSFSPSVTLPMAASLPPIVRHRKRRS